MDWNTYYARFDDWEESTQLRHLSALTDFGPSSQICEVAGAFTEEKHADRLIKKALAAGVRFTAAQVLELDGTVSRELMLPLIRSVPTLTAEELEEFTFWLTKAELRMLAEKNRIPLDECGYVITPEEAALADELRREEEEMRREEEALEQQLAQEAEERRQELLLHYLMISISRKKRLKRRKKQQ